MDEGPDPADAGAGTSNGSITGATSSPGGGATDDGVSSSGDPPWENCLPPEVRGAYQEDLGEAEFDVHEGCDGGYLIEHLGAIPMTTVDDVNAVREEGGLVLGFPGLFGVGTGRCCPDEDPICITLAFEDESIDVPALLEHLRASFPEAGGLCFGFRVLLGQSAPSPG